MIVKSLTYTGEIGESRIFSVWKNVALRRKWSLCHVEIAGLWESRQMIASRQIFAEEASAWNLWKRRARARGNAPLYIDRAKIVNSQWQPSTPLSRTSHAISAPLKISARVWSAKFYAGASCVRKVVRGDNSWQSVHACVRVCARDLCDLTRYTLTKTFNFPASPVYVDPGKLAWRTHNYEGPSRNGKYSFCAECNSYGSQFHSNF